jgi:hypothetical protein
MRCAVGTSLVVCKSSIDHKLRGLPIIVVQDAPQPLTAAHLARHARVERVTIQDEVPGVLEKPINAVGQVTPALLHPVRLADTRCLVVGFRVMEGRESRGGRPKLPF